ncbi:MAG: cupin domain-containing protein [Bacteroidales bacterium]|nr:cupin domain-containing protein [Bacteroidales bacterium]
MYKIIRSEDKTQILEKPKAFLYHKNNEIELVKLNLQQNDEVALHINPIKVVFYVIEGSGVLTIGTSSYTLQAGDMAEVHPDEERGWSNPNPESLKILVIKTL